MDLWVSQQYTITCSFTDVNGAPGDPTTVTFTKQDETGTQTTVVQASLTHPSTGTWAYTTAETTPGTYTWEGRGSGAVIARDLVRVRVRPGIT